MSPYLGRPFARAVLCAAFALVPLVATTARDSHADDVAFVDCPWAPYKEAWSCALPGSFEQGRFNAPPDFRHDDASVQARLRTFVAAKTEPGARSHGRVGVFVPTNDGGWLFVPGSSWSPGDPVFLPAAKTAHK
jgi:hypothetical protein